MNKLEKRLALAVKAMVSSAEGTAEDPNWLAVPSDVFHELVNAYLASRHIAEVPNLTKLLKE